MKPFLFFPLLLLFTSALSQRKVNVTTSIVSPSVVKACYKFDPSDEGERLVEVRLDVDTKGKCHPFIINCMVDDNGAESAPRLEESEIQFSWEECKRGTKTVKLKLILKPLACLNKDEPIKLIFSSADIKGEAATATITIQHLPPVSDEPKVTLLNTSVTLPVWKKGDVADNGKRTILADIVLSGKRSKVPAAGIALNFTSPMKEVLKSHPAVLLSPTLPKDFFPEDGCPVKLTVPVILQLAEVEGLSEDEVFSAALGDDFSHNVKVSIKPVKEPARSEPKQPDTGYIARFTHACFNNLNMDVFVYQKGDTGHVVLQKTGSTEQKTYYFGRQLVLADLAKWISNMYPLTSSGSACSDCVFCATYISERVQHEVALYQEKQAAAAAAAKKAAAADEPATKGDTAKKDTATVKSSPEAKDEKSDTASKKKDTVIYETKFFYNDNDELKLSVTRTPTESQIRICHPLKAGGDTCDNQSAAADLTSEAFQRVITKMTGKLIKEAPIPEKFTPALSDLYMGYQKKVKQNEPKEEAKSNPMIDSLKAFFKNDKDTALVVGELRLKDTAVFVYYGLKVIRKVNIRSVRITISEGKVSKRLLIVETDGGRFINYQAPVPVSHLGNNRKQHFLTNVSGDGYIKLMDVLDYVPNHMYYPDDVENVTLDKDHLERKLTANANLNSIMNVAVFTDLAGLTGRRANAILNTEANVRLITNTSNSRNTDFVWLPKIDLTVTLSKFDSKFRSVDTADVLIGKGGQKDTIDRMALLQKAWVKAEFRVSAFTVRFKQQMQSFSLNAGVRFNAVNADTFFRGKKENYDILVFEYFLEPQYTIYRFKNFGAELAVRYSLHTLADKEPFSNIGNQSMFSPRFALFYYPLGNPSSRIYFRFNYFADKKKEALNFYQMQVGWKTDINFTGKK